MPNKPARDAQSCSTVPKVQSIVVEFANGHTKRVEPLEHGEVKFIFRDGRIVERQAQDNERWY